MTSDEDTLSAYLDVLGELILGKEGCVRETMDRDNETSLMRSTIDSLKLDILPPHKTCRIKTLCIKPYTFILTSDFWNVKLCLK